MSSIPRKPSGLRVWFQALKEESSFLRHYIWKYRGFVGFGLFTLVLVDGLEVLLPFLLKEAVDVAVDQKPLSVLATLALSYLGIVFIQGFCRYAWRMYLIRASLMSGRDIRSKFAHHLFGLSSSFFDRRPIGELMSLATSDVEAVRNTLGSGLLVFADSMFYFISVPIAMYLLSPELTLLAFLPLPIIPFVVMRNEREIHQRFEKVQESFSRLSALTQESLNGIRVTKAFAKEDAQIRRFRNAGEEYVSLNMRLARVQSAFGPTMDLTMSLGLVLLLFVGGKSLIFGTAISLGTFVAFQRYIQKMVWPMAALGMAISSYQRSVSSSGRLKEIFACNTDVPESPKPIVPTFESSTEKDASSVIQLVEGWRTRGQVEFRNLSFRFPGSDHDVLSGISLKIQPGERVAFIGAIGGGKSALLSLLPRLYPVSRGMLYIDGVDVNDWPIDELRKQVGYVSQDVFLFSETVTENIAYGLNEWVDRSSSSVPIEEATRLACVHDDVLNLTGAYRTRVGERGVNLSGGQKQRLTIARAIVKKPSILILDDALSSVDVQTEEKILAGLRSRAGRNTEIIAAHRISTIQDADRIVVLEGGMIRQIGTHQELVQERRGSYRRYYEQQRLKEDLENYSNALDTPDHSIASEVPGASEVRR